MTWIRNRAIAIVMMVTAVLGLSAAPAAAVIRDGAGRMQSSIGGSAGVADGTTSATTASTRTAGTVSVEAASVTLNATRTGTPTAIRCAGSPGIVQISVKQSGEAVSADPRLSGTMSIDARALLNQRSGIGRTSGVLTIKDPSTGKVKLLAQMTQLESQGAAKFDGVLVGILPGQDASLVALYSGNVDFTTGVLTANVGSDAPSVPHDSGVIVTGHCRAS
jgi:hypothetical protein